MRRLIGDKTTIYLISVNIFVTFIYERHQNVHKFNKHNNAWVSDSQRFLSRFLIDTVLRKS